MNNLTNFDFQQFAKGTITKEALGGFRRGATWILPQLQAWFGSVIQLKRQANGLFSATQLIEDNQELARSGKLLYEGLSVPVEVLVGMIRVMTHYPRGDLLNATSQKQTSESGLRYAANVPLVLSAFKEYRNIPYSDWDWSDPMMKHILDSGTAELIPYILDPKPLQAWTKEQLLDIRDLANTKEVALTSLYTITYGNDAEFKRLPRLLKLMLCQTWVYHPSIRHHLGLCSVETLDKHPEPLVSSDIPEVETSPWITTSKSSTATKGKRAWGTPTTSDIPWDI